MEEILNEVKEEYQRANKLFNKFNSAHEGYAILKEEVDELWDEIKNKQNKSFMRNEAIQVAAMAIRFITDVCDK